MAPQRRHFALEGVPDRAEIDGIVAMNQRIAHAIGQIEPQLWVPLREGRVGDLNLVGCFAYDLEIADNGILTERVFLERCLVEPINIAFDPFNSTKDMFDIVLDP